MRKSILFAAAVAAMTILGGAAITAQAAPLSPASAAVHADAAVQTETVAHHSRHNMRRHHRMERRHHRMDRRHHRMERRHYRSPSAHHPRMRHHNR